MSVQRMIEDVLFDAAACRSVLDARVIAALKKVERHRFVPGELGFMAYLNRPLPIGHGQTISQPYIVALMTDLIKVCIGDKVLEIGTGSGYQAAILSEMGARVYSVEIIAALSAQAIENLKSAGYDNVTTRIADGYYGWPDEASVRCDLGDGSGDGSFAALDCAVKAGRLSGDAQRFAVHRSASDQGGKKSGRDDFDSENTACAVCSSDRRALTVFTRCINRAWKV